MTAEHDDLAALLTALNHILREQGSTCVNGVILRFMQVGEAFTGDSGGFRAKESGIFTRYASGGEWQYRGPFGQFNEIVEPILHQAGEVQRAAILLRSSILDTSATFSTMDKEIEADLARLSAVSDQSRANRSA
ncbi:hypothetical protein [Methylogaea oryzae]|uniref:Uncharacterized protein n=1 Tax=Methylogaea oryzae TaxID=1295382 RepID=A0A8D4VRV0_9GAMM|nr:hypothetical protein [Methylogaea oryzae]BBL71442.1 hypothetical protein MoryE10_20480 [Methylogaea oryzae]